MAEYSDQELLNIFRDKEKRNYAFNFIVRKYQERLYWHIRKIVLNHDDTDDILQNTFIKAFQGLENFREEVEEHVFDRYCRAGTCRDLRSFSIDPEKCTGCYVCYNRCPEQAIIGTPRQVHAIIPEKCTGCGQCYEVCKFNAVEIN